MASVDLELPAFEPAKEARPVRAITERRPAELADTRMVGLMLVRFVNMQVCPVYGPACNSSEPPMPQVVASAQEPQQVAALDSDTAHLVERLSDRAGKT